MGTDVYKKLRDHFHLHPMGFPETSTRVELKILSDLFTEEEGSCGMNIESEDLIIHDGAVYISWIMNGERTPGIGLDLSPNQIGSRQSWEYTGDWSQFRHAETCDPMIHCTISHIPPPNFPPEIVAYYPMQLDTLIQTSEQEFWISVEDPYEDSLYYEWRLEEQIIAYDSSVTIQFENNEQYEEV